MTLPRQFLSNTTYFITRRTTQQEFWLKPTKQTTQIFLYCIAIAAEKTGVVVHSATVVSNHWHCIATDPHMKIAEFYAWVHKYVAKAVNCLKGREENLWSTDKPSVIPLESAGAVLDKVTYCLCNPVSAQLVARAKSWKGVWLYKRSHSQTVQRPDVYFKTDGEMPVQIKLQICPPPSHANMSTNEYEITVATEIFRREQEIAAEMRAAHRTFMGMDAVMRQAHHGKPKNAEKRSALHPKFAAKDKHQRISAIKRYKQFVADYMKARKVYKTGNHDVIFPCGTYALRIHAGVKTAPG